MQKVKFIMPTLRVTQGYGRYDNGNVDYTSYSHTGSYALDLGGRDTGQDWAFAPCDVVVKRVYGNYNAVWFESLENVLCADGVARKLVFLLLHINTTDLQELGIAVGKVFRQGEKFYREGTAGATGNHIHLEVGLAPYVPTGWQKTTVVDRTNSYVWKINNQLKPHDVFFLEKNTVILNDGGYDWATVSEMENVAYGCDVSHHQLDSVIDDLAQNGKAEFVITRVSIGTESVDKKLPLFMEKIAKYGLKNGFYVAAYAKGRQEAREEADFAVATVKPYNNEPETAFFYDWEYFSEDYIKENFGITATKELVQDITEGFCERIKELGYVAGVYANKDYLDRFYTQEFWDKHPDYKLWYARPGYSKPDKECYLWQYASDNGLADFGYNGNIDKNILFGEFIEIEPMKPLSEEPVQMYIGFASAGDVKKLVTKINGLGISTEEKDGYIITGLMSRGDQCYIMTDCNALGIPYSIYTPPVEQPEEPEIIKPTTESTAILKFVEALIKFIKEYFGV